MFKNAYQSGFLSILYSIGSKPLQIWGSEGAPRSTPRRKGRHVGARPPHGSPARPTPCRASSLVPAVQDGHITRVTDEDIQSSVLEVAGENVATTFITCPADPAKTLGIRLPFLVLLVKNLDRYFSFEVQVLDDKNVRRRFRASNFQARAMAGGKWRAGGSDGGQGRAG